MPLTIDFGIRPLCVHQRCTAQGIVLLFPGLATVSMRLVEPECGLVSLFHMQPDQACASLTGRALYPAQQFSSDATTASVRCNLQSLNIGSDSVSVGSPFDDGKTCHLASHFGDPCSRIRAADKLTHILAIKTNGRLKADFFKRVKPVKIVRSVRAVNHSPTLRQAASKEPSSGTRMALCLFTCEPINKISAKPWLPDSQSRRRSAGRDGGWWRSHP